MTTQTLVTCNGKINQHGFCDKCYQPAHTTSNQCGRLVPYQQAEINTVLAVSNFPVEFVEWYSGMQKDKILKAYQRWQQEVACASGAVDKTVSVDLCKCDERIAVDGLCLNCRLSR